jgi:hypothetical protein
MIFLLNHPWHKRALQLFFIIVLAHWLEHVIQAIQVFYLHWPRPESRGLIGHYHPMLVQSEWLHYLYAVIMLFGFILLSRGFTGRSALWWDIALGIQFWHHIEHAALLIQAATKHYMFGSSTPISFIQLFIPRIELHLFYNAIVFVPMIVAMIYHTWPPKHEVHAVCGCSRRKPVYLEGGKT